MTQAPAAPLNVFIPGAEVTGPLVLTRVMELAHELDLLCPNVDRQLALSLIVHVPTLLPGDLTDLATQVLRDARRYTTTPLVHHLAARLCTALGTLSRPDPLCA